MKIEFKYDEVIDFIKCHSLLSMSLEERLQTLIESGIIEEENPLEAAKQEYNQEIKDGLVFSLLIKNSFWEATIKEITGNDIRIVDHNDEDITGVNCDACGYIVFEDKEDAFYEICPVCGWQNDGTSGAEYSGCNHSTMDDYKATADFENRVSSGGGKYILRNEDKTS